MGAYARVTGTRGTATQGAAPGPQSPINIYSGAVAAPLSSNFPPIMKGSLASAAGVMLVWTGVRYG